jgi:hypothetical protein
MKSILLTRYPLLVAKRGTVLLLTFLVMTTLSTITASFLYLTSIQTKAGGYDMVSAKALWLAEAGLQQAIWNLKTPVGSGGQGEDWTTTGTTENLGNGSYAMVVERWDFALAVNGASASASSSQGSNVAANAIDGSDTTYWETTSQPSVGNPEEIIILFPYPLTINKVRFLVPAGTEHTPKNYTWGVSSDGVSYTTVVTVNNNTARDVTDTFSAVSNVNYLKLNVTIVGIIIPPGGPPGTVRVRIATLEAIGAKITSTGTVSGLNRKIAQTAVADDATQTAYDEIDWHEVVPPA